MKDRVIAFSPRHWPAVRDILNQCLCQNSATFFHVAPSLADWEQGHLPQGRLLYLDQEGQVQGWAALQPMESPKEAEVSIYVNPTLQGQGIGTIRLSSLLSSAGESGLCLLWAQILENNLASQRLHRKLGFSFQRMEPHPCLSGQRVLFFSKTLDYYTDCLSF